MTIAEAEAAAGFRVGQAVVGKHYHGDPESTPALVRGVVLGFSYDPTDGTSGTTLWVTIQPDDGWYPFSTKATDVSLTQCPEPTTITGELLP
jgi:hypothetical protein